MKFSATVLFLAVALFSQAQKFAYVDSKYILSHIPEYQQAQAEINCEARNIPSSRKNPAY